MRYATNSDGEENTFDQSAKNSNFSIKTLKEAELAVRYRQAFAYAKLFEQGKLETYPIANLLNEL